MGKIVCFGEILWDVFPNGSKKIGGAPLNVALRLSSFGHTVIMVSAIGNDKLGEALLKHIEAHGLHTGFIKKTDTYHTGEVSVVLNEKGSASYTIVHPRAWDKIVLTNDTIQKLSSADALVYGSLVTRDAVSRNTLLALIEKASFNIFDVNLRTPHYSEAILKDLMEKADFIKFNAEELYEIAAYLGSPYNGLEQNLLFVSEKTNTHQICVTKGEHGAVLLKDAQFYYNSGYNIVVKDTVGAGDSFLGTLVSQLLEEKNPQYAIDIACAVGALVAQSEGANPKLSAKDILAFMSGK